MIDTKALRRLAHRHSQCALSIPVKPAAIFEILGRLEAAEKERDDLRAEVGSWKGLAQQFGNEADTLRAAVHHESDCVEACKAEVEALRAELAGLRSSMEFRTSLIGRTEAERDALRAKITEMEKQEPVAFGLYSGWALKATYLSEIEACEQRDRRQLTADLGGSLEAYRVVPLYALPGAQAQPAPSVPEGWKLVPIEPTDEMLRAIRAQRSGARKGRGDRADWKAWLAAAPETKK